MFWFFFVLGGSCVNIIIFFGGLFWLYDFEFLDIEEVFFVKEIEENFWYLFLLEDYEEGYESVMLFDFGLSNLGDYEGFEGIYCFIEECDWVKGLFWFFCLNDVV